ncbi:MAG TPA: crosslink repair DNA glycosylase YcaQ family protein, partial [Acidimicrobiia bacterium]
MTEVLSTRALNRATLQRQFLLERVQRGVPETIEHLVGMQAQNPLDPYYGLWARLEPFQPETLSALIENRSAVRTALLRATIHLVTANDCLGLDATVRPVSRRTFRSTSFSRDTAGMDIEQLLALGRQLLEAEPMGRAQLGK